MDFMQYQVSAYRALGTHDNPKDRANNWCLGLAGEVGEVEEVLKHHYYGGEPLSKDKLAKELGDVLWYLNAIASHHGMCLNIIAKLNLGKLEHRHTQDQFSVDSSQNRHSKENDWMNTEEYKILRHQLQYCLVDSKIINGGYRNEK
jgi:NTP pyrophosphatase (non-canonical NTP hydrolase)